MRFPIASLFFLLTSFLIFVGIVFGSLLLGTVGDAFEDERAGLDDTFGEEIDTIKIAFMIIGIFCLILGLVIFAYDAMADEPEEYFRGYR